MRVQLLNDAEDISWLRSTHLRKLDPPTFSAFEIVGNEDAPERVNLYANREPNLFDRPLAQYTQNSTGSLTKT